MTVRDEYEGDSEMIKVNYDCTTAKMAEQLGIKLYQAMEMGKWMKLQLMKNILSVEEIKKIIWKFVDLSLYKTGYPIKKDKVGEQNCLFDYKESITTKRFNDLAQAIHDEYERRLK